MPMPLPLLLAAPTLVLWQLDLGRRYVTPLDDGSGANRFPTDGANCRGYSSAIPSVKGLG
jgi:hypothetical protein